MAIIEAEGLTKIFKDITAVDDLSFSVSNGSVYGFLGQNGAGKSTTIRMLLTLVRPSAGRISLFGKELFHHRAEVLRQTGVVIEKPDLYNYLTAAENLAMLARLSGVRLTQKELRQQLERVGLAERAGSKVKTFSQGMKQRLGIACALAHDPQLLVLDEPTNGLDPQGIADVRNLILSLSKNEGKTVFVSSHLLSEVEVLADEMLIIDRGRKVAEGKVSELLNPSETLVLLETDNDNRALTYLSATEWKKALQQNGRGLVLKLHRSEIPSLNEDLVRQGIRVYSLRAKHSLEDYFLTLTTANQHVDAYTA